MMFILEFDTPKTKGLATLTPHRFFDRGNEEIGQGYLDSNPNKILFP